MLLRQLSFGVLLVEQLFHVHYKGKALLFFSERRAVIYQPVACQKNKCILKQV